MYTFLWDLDILALLDAWKVVYLNHSSLAPKRISFSFVKEKKKKKKKKSYVEVAIIYGKNESSIQEIAKKEKEICTSFVVAPPTTKVTTTMCDRCLIRMEKALNLYNKIF